MTAAVDAGVHYVVGAAGSSNTMAAAAVAVLVFRCLPWPSLGADRWLDPAFESGHSAVGPEPQR